MNIYLVINHFILILHLFVSIRSMLKSWTVFYAKKLTPVKLWWPTTDQIVLQKELDKIILKENLKNKKKTKILKNRVKIEAISSKQVFNSRLAYNEQ